MLNFAVPGYTSFHGRLQYERLVKPFQPDLLLLAFGFNDGYETRFPEAEFHDLLEAAGLTQGLRGLPLWLFDHTMFSRWSIQRIYAPRSRAIEAEARRRAALGVWRPRVSPQEFTANYTAMIQDARSSGARAFLLNLDLPNTWVTQPLEELSRRLDVPLLDVRALFLAQAQMRCASETSPALPLLPAGIYPRQEETDRVLLLRVHVPEGMRVARAVYVVGNHVVLGGWRPNTVALRNDGQEGDEVAGDRVWSLEVRVSDMSLLNFAFTNSGPPGRWVENEPIFENTFKAIRYYHALDLSTVPEATRWVSPLYELDRVPFDCLVIPDDPIHPNAEGHRLIAQELADRLLEMIPTR